MTARAAQVDQLVAALNPEQRAAVLHRGSPVLVLAGAGTGKTRVITVRIAHLVAHHQVAPESVLALTFTNKAAGEMAERVGHFLGKDAAQAMTIGTFHSLGLQMLERDAKRLGFKRGISLLDAADQASAVRHCLKQLRIDPKRHDPRAFLMAIGNARNADITPEDLLDTPGRELTGKVYRAYLQWLEAYQAMDFDDLILRSNQLLREHPDALTKWRGRFRTILVDEYQDTNLAQLELVSHLAADHRQLCVVGDDDQSIYGWRGADVRNILEFEKHFPDATALALTQNYRSTGHILAAANAVIGNKARREKSLWTDSGEGEAVRVVLCKDPSGEAAFVAAEIQRLRGKLQLAFRDFGVLFRASAQTTAIEEAFRLTGIPYRVVGAYEFFESKEIKDVLSYLRLATNPHDDATILRIINFPQRGVGPKTIELLHTAAAERGRGLFEVVEHADEVKGLTKDQTEKLLVLAALIRDSGGFLAGQKSLTELVRWIIAELGAREAWIRDPTEGPGGDRRWKNVEALIAMLTAWEKRHPQGQIRDWLRVVALDSKNVGERDPDEDKVALLTLHSAKGLEWPVAFVIGCQEGLIPHQRTIDAADGNIAEERRLFYVGITRARRHCFLTYAKVRTGFHGAEPTRPSRFLREIPGPHRDDLDRQKGGGPATKEETRARFEALRARIAGK